MTGRSHAMVERDNQMAKLTAEGLTRKQIFFYEALGFKVVAA